MIYLDWTIEEKEDKVIATKDGKQIEAPTIDSIMRAIVVLVNEETEWD